MLSRAAGDASEEALDRLPTSATCINLLKLPPYRRAAGDAPEEALDRLPTSATCINFLKLPPYRRFKANTSNARGLGNWDSLSHLFLNTSNAGGLGNWDSLSHLVLNSTRTTYPVFYTADSTVTILKDTLRPIQGVSMFREVQGQVTLQFGGAAGQLSG
ncbi:HECT [Macleaya cordata]|uniref:HECT-type E3 ubiquitin transferase n=1 Tax=Macleaya cordata TaxID=56857 RepID=A0A200R1W4_MACCD|nr:HECT [Macleaya cordata]